MKQGLALILGALLFGCSNSNDNSDNEDTDPPTPEVGDWYKPPVMTTWQWQLMGDVNEAYAVDIYDIDLFDVPLEQIQQFQSSGIRVICYFSGGSYEEWRDDANQFLATDLGNPLEDWEGERWLDIRSNNVRDIMKQRLALAKQKGCDGVEPDNMDGYQNQPGFNFNGNDQLDYNRFIANEAHKLNLSVGLKNDLDQIEELVEYFDFAVNEQCFEYDECDRLTPFIMAGKPVFNAEYLAKYVNNESERAALCDDALSRQFSTLILPINLDDEFRLSCLP
ncbi:endo alpha-1,4 polygalactosaminidase [Pleionea sediminis]|uniref:endo alpha-1,4 polygalactosaminidase n=1 Tax=Pleionea sediminis TaxID=2569479 RepID=UPI0011850A23|nr:endo alpha-1,4 polygalactosaminidase [Pleionea sediminis]